MELMYLINNSNDGIISSIINPPCRGHYTDFRVWISNDLKWQYFYAGTKDLALIELPNVSGESKTMNVQGGLFVPLHQLAGLVGTKVATFFSKKKIYINSAKDKLKIFLGENNNQVWAIVQATFVPKKGEILYSQRNFTWTSAVSLTLVQAVQFLEQGRIHSISMRIVVPKGSTGVAIFRPYFVAKEDINFISQALTSGDQLGDILVSDAQSDGMFHGAATGLEPYTVKSDLDEDTVKIIELPYSGEKVNRGDLILFDVDKETGTIANMEIFITAKYEVTSTKGHQALKTEYLKLNEETLGIVDLGLIL